MKTLTFEADGSITVKDGLGCVWSYANKIEAAKVAAEFTGPELLASPAVATLLSAPATLAAMALQRAPNT